MDIFEALVCGPVELYCVYVDKSFNPNPTSPLLRSRAPQNI